MAVGGGALNADVVDDLATDDALERHFGAMSLAMLRRTIAAYEGARVDAIAYGAEVEQFYRRRIVIARRVLDERDPTPTQGRLL